MIYEDINENSEFAEIGKISVECSNLDIEYKFIEELSDFLTNLLKINWNDKLIVKNLLINGLSKKLNNRTWIDSKGKKRGGETGLLQQYQNYILDESIQRIKRECKIPDDIKINHGYALHAKFADIAKYLKTNLKDNKDNEDKK